MVVAQALRVPWEAHEGDVELTPLRVGRRRRSQGSDGRALAASHSCQDLLTAGEQGGAVFPAPAWPLCV